MSKDILYLKSNIKNCEYLYSGISFNDFIKSLNNKFENIVLLKADYIGNSFRRNFEIVEGIENIIKLAKEDIYGDFSFVDCSKNDSIEKLEDIEIAELLFLEHMKYPLNSPFFDALGNRFVYLSHDNDFYCKLYCKTENDILNMLSYKIQNKLTKLICGLTSKPSDLSFRFTIKNTISKKLGIDVVESILPKKLLNLSESGLLIDFNDIELSNNTVILNLYIIGKTTDMDNIINNKNDYKVNAIDTLKLIYKDDNWIISQ